MKKIIPIIVLILVVVGCGNKKEQESKKQQEKIIGTWETKYELLSFGEVTESYVFKEKGECVRILNTGSDIVDKCTYELNEEKDGIRIIWENKMDKERYSRYVEIDDNDIMIDEHKYTRKKEL